jgi:hypothetical protein
MGSGKSWGILRLDIYLKQATKTHAAPVDLHRLRRGALTSSNALTRVLQRNGIQTVAIAGSLTLSRPVSTRPARRRRNEASALSVIEMSYQP